MSAQAWDSTAPNWLSRLLTEHSRAVRVTLARLRNRPFGTALTAFVLGITLALPVGLHALLDKFDRVSSGWQGALRASLFLKDSVDVDQGQALTRRIAARPGIADARYLSREQALAEFKAHSGFALALDLLKDNPLPAVIVVTPDPRKPKSQVQPLLKELASAPEVEFAKIDQQWLERLYAILDLVQRGVLLIAGLLAVAVLVVVANTIRLDIEGSRDEIVVLRLIGATKSFIRRPFLYTGLWYGLAGSIIACLLVYAVGIALLGPTRALAGLYGSSLELSGLSADEVFATLGAGLALGWLGAFWTVSRHLGSSDRFR
jgi:cell division transport system permease protein